MKDTRITVRLTPEEHEQFKILAIKIGKPMTEILSDYIKELIKEEVFEKMWTEPVKSDNSKKRPLIVELKLR